MTQSMSVLTGTLLTGTLGLATVCAIGCTGGEPRQPAPRPEIGVVRTPSRHCTGTGVGRGEVLTAASCIAGASADALSFTAFEGSGARSVQWVVSGPALGEQENEDWAILALTESNERWEVGARYLGPERRDPPALSSTLWWAALARDGRGIEAGLCAVEGTPKPHRGFDFHLLRHDCEFSGAAPGVLLYHLDELTPRAVAFQGSGPLAIPVQAFSDAPVPAVDLSVSSETFIGTDSALLHALNGQGRLVQRRRVGATWLNWTEANHPPARMVRLDGTARARDFTGRALERLWTLDEHGRLYLYSLGEDGWTPDDAPTRFQDLSVAPSDDGATRLFGLTRDERLCTRTDTDDGATAWSCTDVGSGGVALDALRVTGGYLVVLARASQLLAVPFTHGQWQSPIAFGEEGTYHAVTAGATEQGSLYVIAARLDRLRIRVGSSGGDTWSEWAPFYGGQLSGKLTALDSAHSDNQPNVVYAIVDGEVFTATERPEAGLDHWLANPTHAAEFDAWKRLEGLAAARDEP